MKTNKLLISIAFILSGCVEQTKPAKGYDACLEREIFKECVASIHTSDHGESVKACSTAAFHKSIRPIYLIKEECK